MKAFLLGSTLFLGAALAGHASILIDSFGLGLNLTIESFATNPAEMSGGNTPGAGVAIGGSRGVRLTREGNAAASLSIDQVGSGTLELLSGLFNSFTAFLQYDGDQSPNLTNTGGLGAIDLTQGGLNTRFVIAQHLEASQGSPPPVLTMIVHTNTGSSSLSVDSVMASFLGPFVLVEFPFAQFIGTANFASVGAIELFINGANSAGTLFDMDYIEVNGTVDGVPEPASLYLGGAGLLGICLIRRSVRPSPNS